MLSKGEKLAVDRLAYCMNITRSGLVSSIMADYLEATKDSKAGRAAEKRLLASLEGCRDSLKQRGEEAAKWILP